MNELSEVSPRHPGEHLKQLLADKGLTQSDLAFILGQSLTGINLITSGKRSISPDMSKALGIALSLPSKYFAELQTQYDLARANDPDPSVTLRATMLQRYPIREMIKRGWLDDADADQIQRQLAKFFGLENVDEIPYLAHAAKKSNYEEREIPPAQLAWLFRVRQIAKSMVVPKYSRRALTEALIRFKAMLMTPEETRHIPRIMMECGVRFIIVETLPQAKIDGVCLWLDANSPVIGISARFDRIDNFWFVLRHEIEHVLRKDGMDEDIVDADLEGPRAGTDETLLPRERVANAAASDFGVATAKLESFIRRKNPFFYEKDVVAFAKLNGTHPGIVVGQLQRRLNKYDYLKKYQVKVRQFILPGAIADGWGQSVPLQGAV